MDSLDYCADCGRRLKDHRVDACPSCSEWLDGPKLAAWINKQGVADDLYMWEAPMARTLSAWEHGRWAYLPAVDRVLTRLDLHLSGVPADCFLPRRPSYEDFTGDRAEVLEFAREHGPELAGRRYSLSRDRIVKWMRDAKVRYEPMRLHGPRLAKFMEDNDVGMVSQSRDQWFRQSLPYSKYGRVRLVAPEKAGEVLERHGLTLDDLPADCWVRRRAKPRRLKAAA